MIFFRRFFYLLAFCACLLLLSCKSVKLSDAVAKQELGEYFDAGQIYRKVYGKVPPKNKEQRAYVAYNMGECFRKSNNTQRALSGYQNAIRYQHPDSMAYFYAAKMAHKSGKYVDAIKYYRSFLAFDSTNVLSLNGIKGCDSALLWKANPNLYEVKRMDKMNSRDGEFAPMLTGEKYDNLYITSSRKDALGKDKSPITGARNNDLFLIKKDERGNWQAPSIIEDEVNTDFDEGICSFSPDGSTMYYTYCSSDPLGSRTAEIYTSSRSGAKWGKGARLEIFKDTLTMAAHPSVDPSGEYLYFTSDAAGGMGGKDIWRISIEGIGSSFPENMGPEINTAGDEMFPSARSSSCFYFSSDGHPGMGGLDIFRADFNADKWTIENLKSPMNSMADDFGISFAGERDYGFFSSNRQDARGYDHIFSFVWPEVSVFVEGWVLDRDEEEIANAIVRIVGKDGTNEKIIVKKDGAYKLKMTRGMEYVMMASASGYLNQKQILVAPSEEKNETLYIDFSLPSISKPVVVENIFYEFDKATLTNNSKEALDELLLMLNDNPNITIELSAHTDRKGSAQYNQNLSQRRAQSVVDYLIKGGIEKDRLTAVGYGKENPKHVTKNMLKTYDFLEEGAVLDEEYILGLSPEEQAAADQINRRTEFKVLKTNYRLF